jgi:hypothetical protein
MIASTLHLSSRRPSEPCPSAPPFVVLVDVASSMLSLLFSPPLTHDISYLLSFRSSLDIFLLRYVPT